MNARPLDDGLRVSTLALRLDSKPERAARELGDAQEVSAPMAQRAVAVTVGRPAPRSRASTCPPPVRAPRDDFRGEVRREQAQPGQVHLSEAHCVDDRGNLSRCACHQDAVVGGTLRTSAPQGRRRTSKRKTVRGRACARRSRRGAAGGLPPFGTSPRRALESRHDVQDRASGDASPALRTRPRAGVRPVPRVMAKKCQRESRFIGQMTDASVGARFREPRACPGTSWTGVWTGRA